MARKISFAVQKIAQISMGMGLQPISKVINHPNK